MNKKYYLSSLAAVTLLAGCTSDELVPQQNEEVADVLANRPKIEVAFGLETSATRMHGNETGVTFDKNDYLGAVLVDQGLSTPANYYDLASGNTHIANNKFYYNEEGKNFVTDGTMCVGAWLFYANYDAANTTSRGSIKYTLPIVQEYAQDYNEMAKHDFKFSPIINLEGKENGNFTDEPRPDYAFTIPMISAFTYARINLTFPKEVTVQKLVLKPSSVAAGTNYDEFFNTYELNNGATNINGLSTAVADLNHYPATVWRNGVQVYVTRQGRLNEQRDALMSKDNYIYATVGAGMANKDVQLIALNCLDSKLEPSKEFMTNMLIPSGEYNCIRLYAYTDKGVYVYNINDECEAAQTDPNDPAAVRPASLPGQDLGAITLKRERVTMHNIAAVSANSNQDYKDIETKAIRMTETKNNVELQDPTETDGTVVISQKDLVAVINGITVAGQMNVRVLGDMVKITEEVATAIDDAEKRVNGDIQVLFDKAIAIEGSAEGYKLNDVTFAGSATLTKGRITLGEDINIPASKQLTVKAGATLDVNTLANYTGKGYIYNKITNMGTLNANVSGLEVGTVANSGTFNVIKKAEVSSLTNSGNVNIDNTLTTAFTSTNGTITNNATLDIVGNSSNKAVYDSEGRLVGATIMNNGVINVKGAAAFENKGIINNAKDAKIISGAAGVNGSSITNQVGAVVNNDGFLYCYNGQNTIRNLGIINANSGSTTYITYNSDASEISTPTRSNTMGVINLANRSEDVSVTTTTQKGYIVWTTAETAIRHQSGDKYNKVVLSSVATVSDSAVRYIETSKNLTITTSQVQELTFTESATLLTTTATVGYLEIATDKIVKLPTENEIAIETVTTTSDSKTVAAINNKGTLLVGGDLWSSEIGTCPTQGIFAAGDGNNTAFHWGTGK